MFPYKQITHNGKVMQEHRYIMENHLGRKLRKNELIHHIDGNPKNNDINNLQVMSWRNHALLHAKKAETIEIKCSNCKNKFLIRKRRYNRVKKKGQKVFVCSKRCHGLMMAKYLPHEKESKYKKLINKELKNGLTGYQIGKKYNICKATVYNYIRNHSPIA